ncbi:MAG: LPS assembly protein LptD [Candidatus Omnitrophota bacterium]|nr:LPS assembly protein LptD [Candidatus Omnitrophota bacterium]
MISYGSASGFCAEEIEPIIVDGDKVEVISGENKILAEGNIVIVHKGSKLTCDKVTVNTQTKDAHAFGNVRIESEGSVILADEANYNLDTQKGTMDNARLTSLPFYASADLMEKISDKEVRMYKGYFTTCDRDKPHYRLKAKEIDFALGEKVTARGIDFMLYNSSLAYLPNYVHPLNDNRPRVTVTPGMSKDWGYYVLSAWRYYLNEDLRGRIHLDYRERKDFASGFDTKYETHLFGEGFLRTYYMNERNVELKKPWINSLSENINEEILKKEDVDEKNRNTVERERYRISLRHKWDMDEDTSLKLEYSRLSDANFMNDYFLREQEKDVTNTSYLLFTRLMPFSTFSILAQKRTNRFMAETEKLPEVKWDISSTEIGETKLYYSGVASVVNLNSKAAAPSDTTNHVSRIDSYSQLSYPKKIGFVETSPYVALRETYYDRDRDSESDDALRSTFYTGIDMSTKFYRIFDAKTDFLKLDINKLRHVITPSVSYGYIHEPTVPSSKFFAFDGIDSIAKSNSASLGLENKLQTKRSGKSVDLVRFIMDTRYDFHLKPQGSRFGNINFDFEATPYEWMRFEADSEYDKDDRAFKAANFDLVLMGDKENHKTEGDDYKYFFGAGYRYQRNNRNQFTGQLVYRLNEDWKFRVYERWERETGGVREQNYIIYKNLHCWQVEINYNVRRGYGEEIFLVFRIKAFPENGVEFSNGYHAPKEGSQSY